MKALIAVTLASVLLTGCAHRPPVPEWQLGRYSFHYEIDNPGRTGLIQVFDDGKVTYLQFADMGEGGKRVRIRIGESKAQKPFKLIGSFLAVQGVHDLLFVTSGCPQKGGKDKPCSSTIRRGRS